MPTFHPSSSLQQPTPSTSSTILSTTSSFQTTVESHPTHSKWWIRNYGVGSNQQARYLTRGTAPENRFRKVQFRTISGHMPIVGLNFGPSGEGGALAVASGPRVSVYGGKEGGGSDLNRALKAKSPKQEKSEGDEEEEEVDLFGGKTEERSSDDLGKDSKADDQLDKIEADRQVSTGGLLSQCAVYRSDGRLIAIGTEGGAVKICDANSRATLRTFGSSGAGGGDRKAIRSLAWLRDGKRVVAGGDDAVIRVWNVGGGMKDTGLGGDGADLSLAGHGDSIRAVAVVSFQKEDHMHNSHRGRGRKGKGKSLHSVDQNSLSSDWGQLVVSASYDHTVRVWDIGPNDDEKEQNRGEDRCLSIMNHGDPVQALLVLPPSSNFGNQIGKATKFSNLALIVSAGGTVLKIWNPFNGSCLCTMQTKHAKTITSMCLLDICNGKEGIDDEDNIQEGGVPDPANSIFQKLQIVTAGLDGLIRIHSASIDDISSGCLRFLHGTQISEPISALALSQDLSRFAIGTTTGIVIVHQRRRCAISSEPTINAQVRQKRKEPRPGTYAYFMRGAHEKLHGHDDYLLTHQKKQKLAEYDLLLRRFQYGDALDAVLQTRQPQVVIAVIEELGKRRGLAIALSNRDEESLEAILSFTIRFVDDPRYTPFLIGVAHKLCDIYGSLLGQSMVIDELFSKLRKKVANECNTQKMILRLLGQIDFVMAAAEAENTEALIG